MVSAASIDMLPTNNPYESPKSDHADPRLEVRRNHGAAKRLLLGWILVFGLNVVVPLLIGWGATTPDGRKGMFLAMAVILVLGLWICAGARQLAFPLVVGGVAVALSQVFPILQMMAGILGFALAKAVGAVQTPDGIAHDGFPDVETVAAGFLITMVTGGVLVAVSFVAGLAIRGVLSLRGSRTD